MKNFFRYLLAISGSIILQTFFILTMFNGNFILKCLEFVLMVGLLSQYFKKDIDKNLE